VGEFLEAIGGWTWYLVWSLLLLAASLLVYLGLGGTFVVFGLALVHAIVTGFDPIGWPLLGVLLAIALFGELAEFVLGNFYALRKGASNRGTVGGFAGGLLGALAGNAVFPVAGAVLGSFLGAFLGSVGGEYSEQRRLAPSVRVGGHAFVGRLLAILVKHALGLVMVVLIMRATFPKS
jgi:uncharacterized protein YqgC (DUF456 family)